MVELAIEVGRSSKEFIQPGLERHYWRGSKVIVVVFIHIWFCEYFAYKGGVIAGCLLGESCYHSVWEELDPISLFPDVLLYGEQKVWGLIGVIVDILFGLGAFVHKVVMQLASKNASCSSQAQPCSQA
jgi:hypothetical protein